MTFIYQKDTGKIIDDKRDCVMVRTGGHDFFYNEFRTHQVPGIVYTMWWEKNRIEMEIFENTLPEGGVHFHIEKCKYEQHLKPFRMSIREMITDALRVYGAATLKNLNDDVRITINENIGNLSPDEERAYMVTKQ